MNFFRRLFGGSEPQAVESEPREAQQETPAKESKEKSRVYTILLGTKMPIDAIYEFVGRDNEEMGYNDAFANSDSQYCKQKEEIILHELTLLFNRVKLRYQAEIAEVEVKMASAQELFATNTASAYQARLNTLKDHLAEIERMMAKVADKAPEMMTMIDTYRRGFIKGCKAQADLYLNGINAENED